MVQNGDKMKDAAVGIVLKNDSQILVIKRRDIPMWVIPGGGVDADEDPAKAVVREVLEETGLEVKIQRKIAEYTPVNRLTRLVHLYECTPVKGELTTGSETIELNYFPIKSLPTPFFHIHEEWIEDMLKNEVGVIRRPLKSVTYSALFCYFIRHPWRVLRFVCSRWGFPINS